MFEKFTTYPVQIVNWHDQETSPTLKEALNQFPGSVCGGINRQETLVLGNPDDVIREARAAIHSTEGKRFILGTGCVTPTNAPYGNILAVRNSIY